MNKPKIVLLGTGGTIVSSGASETQMTGYSIQDVQVSDIIRAVPSLKEVAELESVSVCNIPSSCINASIWFDLARECQKACDDESVTGVVITHGTDTMEETAFFLNLVLKTQKPVVLTGAMRPSTALSADGPLNLLNAVRVASDSQSVGKGVLVCLNGIINSARDVTKTNTTAVQTFKSLDFGMLGFVVGNEVCYYTQSTRPHTMATEFSLTDFEGMTDLPCVDIVYAHADDDARLVDAAVQTGARGIIHAGTGHGTISDKVQEALFAAAKKGVVVVRASRVVTGPVLNSLTRWQEAGFIPSRTFSAQKARVLLQLLLLRHGNNVAEIAKRFDLY